MTVSRNSFPAALLLLLLLPAASAAGRVISYSPITDQAAVPAHQLRTNRYFALVEGPATTAGIIGGRTSAYPGGATLVLYDSAGEHEPRVIYPTEGRPVFYAAAVHENASGVPRIFVFVQEHGGMHSRLSVDAGATWKTLDIPIAHTLPRMATGTDVGGPFAAARGSLIRIGNDEWPFIVSTRRGLWAVGGDGSLRTLAQQTNNVEIAVIGRNTSGTQFLVTAANKLYVFDISSRTTTLTATTAGGFVDGWITAAGDVYVEEWHGRALRILHFRNGTRTTVVEAGGDAMGQNVFAVPTHDYSGAWIIRRGLGKATTLYSHSPATSTVQHWQDESGPEVEALHSGSSGTKLLVQVHRPRTEPQRMFLDPALAVWMVGDPPPVHYDELFMDEQRNKGFVHLDVETIEEGAPFVFDSGVAFPRIPPGIAPPPPPAGGGGDVLQEWGVVRASLKQRLVLPAIGRTRGAFSSDWLTDVIIYNPMDRRQRVDLRFSPSGASAPTDSRLRTIELAPKEVRLIPDALTSLFGIESGTGALFINPEHAVSLMSRTYSRAGGGTYGFGMNAMDVYASAGSARFPLTFSGAFPGSNYRTNVILTDAARHGAAVVLKVAGGSGLIGSTAGWLEVAAGGQQQFNQLGATLGLASHETGALLVRPARGSVIPAVFTIDNRTNDSTYFPADLSSAPVRTIPAIGHIEGANNSRFRSDLYLHNPTRETRSVLLQAHLWDSGEPERTTVTLAPDEARVIPDAMMTLFRRTGIASLRVGSQFEEPSGIRITSRTYSVDEDGGTYGFLMPPLNNFQTGTAGDTLEILGAIADPQFRTNIGLVELTSGGGGPPANVRIEIVDSTGNPVDTLTANVPMSRGIQLNDIFNARGIDVSGPVLIRVSPLSGVIGAYGASVDNITNDSLYLGANLGASR